MPFKGRVVNSLYSSGGMFLFRWLFWIVSSKRGVMSNIPAKFTSPVASPFIRGVAHRLLSCSISHPRYFVESIQRWKGSLRPGKAQKHHRVDSTNSSGTCRPARTSSKCKHTWMLARL